MSDRNKESDFLKEFWKTPRSGGFHPDPPATPRPDVSPPPQNKKPESTKSFTTPHVIKNLTKHGNDLALVIEKPIMDLLGVDADTPFELTTDGQSLILSPIRDPERRKAVQSAIEEANRKYGQALKKLAE